MNRILQNMEQVRRQIADACARAGRDPAGVQLLAVSKTFGIEAIAEAIAAGQRAFGENYIQEAVEKIVHFRAQPEAAPGLQWHCIGPIQSNKTRLVAEHFDWVHTIDRAKIAQRLSEQRPAHLPPLQVCLQINPDGGATKSGIAPADAPALLRELLALPRLQWRGVMSIPDIAPDFEAQCAVHKSVRAVFDKITALGLPGLERWDTVSLGMTADLQAAISAGSTMVRVGTGIFGQRHYA
ncbi:MAG: YggS family pyridoxal phosphate-dependent enzyme [Comamonas sp.]